MKRPNISLSDENEAVIINGIAWPYKLFVLATDAPEGSKGEIVRGNNCIGFNSPIFQGQKKKTKAPTGDPGLPPYPKENSGGKDEKQKRA